jgi:curved DNA-binding protein CbpA
MADRPRYERDLYQVLGLSPGASHADIVRAYRQKARTMHPDARPEDPVAPDQFQALTDAYDVLGDPARRERYDRASARPAAADPLPPVPPTTGAGPVRAGPLRAGPVRAGPVRAGPVRAGPVRAGPVRAGPVHVEPPAASAGPDGQADGHDERLALLAYLISRYLHRETGWPL